ncbi:MAG TPA: choice-of-anchor tandem repeat GloVer-containing protein [Rhizomicrobium sp.]|nr:choice-of-anchor tandem repeat GloVer-containing protein [Rhizomicrobium sp.]
MLHAFLNVDGRFPAHGVVLDNDGNLYGATRNGGDHDSGAVFKLAPDGQVTTLHSFNGWDGVDPYGRLDIDKDGNLYGATGTGGSGAEGTVFKIAADGTFHALQLLQRQAWRRAARRCAVYGRQRLWHRQPGRRRSCGCGVVYEITASGKEKVLHTFTGSDGGGYSAGLVRNRGTFYSTTTAFGAHSKGVVFSVTRK